MGTRTWQRKNHKRISLVFASTVFRARSTLDPLSPSISVTPFKNMALGYRDPIGIRDHEEENLDPKNPVSSFGELLFLLRSRQRLLRTGWLSSAMTTIFVSMTSRWLQIPIWPQWLRPLLRFTAMTQDGCQCTKTFLRRTTVFGLSFGATFRAIEGSPAQPLALGLKEAVL